MTVLGMVLDRQLTFYIHATSVVRACKYRLQAISYIRHILTTELALTLACSPILSGLDCCNVVLHGAPPDSIQNLQNDAAQIVQPAPKRPSAQSVFEQLQWLPVCHHVYYKLAILTYKIRSTSTPSYLSRHIVLHVPARHFHSSITPLCYNPTARTRITDYAVRCSAITVLNCPITDIASSCSLKTLQSN